MSLKNDQVNLLKSLFLVFKIDQTFFTHFLSKLVDLSEHVIRVLHSAGAVHLRRDGAYLVRQRQVQRVQVAEGGRLVAGRDDGVGEVQRARAAERPVGAHHRSESSVLLRELFHQVQFSFCVVTAKVE